MDVAETNIFRIADAYRIPKWLIAADDAVHVEIGDGDVARIPYLQRQRKPSLAAFLFRLQGVDLPVGYVESRGFTLG